MIPRKASKFIFTKELETFHDDFYREEIIETYCDDDLINSAEQGFMLGYLNA